MYKKDLAEYEEILKVANRIKDGLDSPDAPKFPEISDLRDIDYMFYRREFFGKYVAQIFAEINGKQSRKM